MILSVIIPMYNAEKYIGDCIDSLLSQNLDLDEYEIIIVNDGSKDKSFEIAKTYSEKAPNIKLLTQENSGNGAARNKALKHAKGKYIYFLDSDDYIASNTLPYLIKKLQDDDLEIIGFQSTSTNSSNLKKSSNIERFNDQFKTEVVDGVTFLSDYNFRAEVWWFIIKREFFINTGIEFYPRKFVQDSYITPSIFVNAKRVSFVPMDVHRYRFNETSITNTKTPDHIRTHMNDLVFAVSKLKKLIDDITHKGCIERLKNRQQSYVFFFIVRFAKSNMSFKELNKILGEFKTVGAYPLNKFVGKDYNGLRYKVLTFIFNTPFLLYPFLYLMRLKNRISI